MALPAALILLLLALAAPAEAARVSVKVGPEPTGIREDISDSDQFVFLRARPGERNRVTVRRRKELVVVVRDHGARVRPGRRCRRLNRHAARCRFEDVYYAKRFEARLGDRGDRVLHVRGPIEATLRGGEGDDVLVGGELFDGFHGGPGDDVLRGRGSFDFLSGGPDDDELSGGSGRDYLIDGQGTDVLRGGPSDDDLRSIDPLSRDALHGGAGRDRVDYGNRRKPVVIALSSGAGEDDIVGVEDVQGGVADDVIVGDEGPNGVTNYGGDDAIDARGGDDTITTSGAEDVTCGAGADGVFAQSNRAPLLRTDCERVGNVPPAVPAQPVQVTGDTVTLSVQCRSTAAAVRLVTPPAGRPWFTGGPFETVLASGSADPGRYDQACPVVLALTDAGRSLARPLPAVVTVGSDDYGSWAFLLR